MGWGDMGFVKINESPQVKCVSLINLLNYVQVRISQSELKIIKIHEKYKPGTEISYLLILGPPPSPPPPYLASLSIQYAN